eukprot:12892652-Alexandrium_andersonii.AAC.1
MPSGQKRNPRISKPSSSGRRPPPAGSPRGTPKATEGKGGGRTLTSTRAQAHTHTRTQHTQAPHVRCLLYTSPSPRD